MSASGNSGFPTSRHRFLLRHGCRKRLARRSPDLGTISGIKEIRSGVVILVIVEAVQKGK
jgi:hypothetical protein